MVNEKTRTLLLGLAFLIFLALSYIENTTFFQVLKDILQNQLLAVLMLFVHNVLVVSLITLGMTFYVSLVISGIFKKEKYGHVVLEYPKTFAIIFTAMILLLSILRGSSLLGGISMEALPLVILVSAPIGIVEGYATYLAIKKTLSRTMSIKDLAQVYGIFFIAAIMEVCFINLLILVSQA